MRVPRSEGERVCDPVRRVIHNVHRIKPPSPSPPTPCYRHLFLRRSESPEGVLLRQDDP